MTIVKRDLILRHGNLALPPRPFIVVKEGGTGFTNITDSELAYLGYGAIQSHGLSYYAGNGSVIRGNNIHHLEMGFYSDGVEGILIENNHIHHNKVLWIGSTLGYS